MLIQVKKNLKTLIQIGTFFLYLSHYYKVYPSNSFCHNTILVKVVNILTLLLNQRNRRAREAVVAIREG